MVRNNLKILDIIYYLGFICMFLPCFVIFIIPKTTVNFYFGAIFWCSIFILLFYQNKEKFMLFLSKFIKTKVIRLYLLFMFFLFITTCIHLLIGYSIIAWYNNLFYQINALLCMIFVYFFIPLALYLRISVKNIIKLFYILIYILFLVGLIQEIAIVFDIKIINMIINFLTNSRYGYEEGIYITRVFSLLKEPSILATYIYILLPFVIIITTTKYKLIKNKYINILLKKTILPLAMLNLVFTMSPIYIIACSIELIIIYGIYYKNAIKKNFCLITAVFLLLVCPLFLLSYNDLYNNTNNNFVIARIKKTLLSYTDYNLLVYEEPSLATRIGSYALYWETFKHNKLFGVGFNNSHSYATKIFYKDGLPKTLELTEKYKQNSWIKLSSSILWKLLAETGLIGTFLYFWFCIYNIKLLNKIKNFYAGVTYKFLTALQYSFVAITVFLTFYCFNIDEILIWQLYGFNLMFYINLKMKPILYLQKEKLYGNK